MAQVVILGVGLAFGLIIRTPQKICVNATPINQLPQWPARQA